MRVNGMRLYGVMCVVGLVAAWAGECRGQGVPADLPEAEKRLVDSVDPWGSAFGDQLAIFRGYFAGKPDAAMAVGYTHSLVKIWPNKYWFHGTEVFTGAENAVKAPLWGVTGGTVSFQVAVLPKMGAAAGEYKVKAEVVGAAAGVGVKVYREEFVEIGRAAYPRMETSVWPDPLVEAETCALEGTDAGVFLVEMELPRDFKGKTFTCKVRVEKTGGGSVAIDVPVRVVKLDLGPAPFPLVANFNKERVGDGDYRGSLDLLLKHHLQPLDAGFLIGEVWKKEGEAGMEKEVRRRMALGQTVFYMPPGDEKLYAFLKGQGWEGKFITQVGPDEPNAETFAGQNIPQVKAFRVKFPGVRVLLASMGHARMAEGCDIQLNDLSTTTYDPRNGKLKEPPEMWHYYCHLPIQAEYRAPVVQAPNMMIDNPALEQRLAVWMSWHYGARGVFIWAGNEELTAKDFWKNKPLKIEQDKPTFPYGGVHHGNGFLVYPPREKGGVVVPSLRLKMLRDGMEDVAIFEAIAKKMGKRPEWLSPVPGVFVHPHYFDQLPEGLLGKREKILQMYEGWQEF
jgi:hypothetical protein